MLIFKRNFSGDNRGKLRKGAGSMVDYSPLWVTMKKRGVTTYTLIYKLGFSAYTITNLRRNKSITMNTLEKLCQALSCTPNDVVRFIEEPEKRPVP